MCINCIIISFLIRFLVDEGGRISYGHILHHASLFRSITCVSFTSPFSSFHPLLDFSRFVSVVLFLCYPALQIRKPSLSHFHLPSKHDCTHHRILHALAILCKDSSIANMSINSSLLLQPNNFFFYNQYGHQLLAVSSI